MVKKKDDFETNLESLKEIITDIESGEFSLTDTLSKFENGVKLYSSCLKKLDLATKKITILTNNIESGEFEEKPFIKEN